MSSSDVAIKSMDLARSITDILGKGGAVSGLVGETMKWLARERIDEAEFTSCLSKARALLYPNSKGPEIQNSLRKSADELKRNPYIAGLSLLGAGNIGRWMAQSPEYCYLATTVATLVIHHDMSYAADAVCDMVLSATQQVDDRMSVQDHEVRRSQLRSVLGKIVESIMLNVVNCGQDLGSLPLQLRDICGHTCNAKTFAAVSMALAKGSDNLIIRCKKFLVDVFVWTLAHIKGNVVLSITGQIVYREKPGPDQRSLLFLVDEDCSCSQQQPPVADKRTDHTITVSTSMESDLRTVLKWSGLLKNVCGNRSSTRAPFYDLDGSTGCKLGKLLPAEKRDILRASQKIVLWALRQSACLFSLGPYVIPESSNILVGDWLSRWPRICNESFDEARMPATTTYSGLKFHSDDVLLEFAETRAVMDACSSRCSCQHCDEREPKVPYRSGCLKATARSEILRTIAHAIADGFGADDASGIAEPGSIETATSRLLATLLTDNFVSWESWFGLAAGVYLGCPIISGLAVSNVVAIQFGSLVVVAPWVDMRTEMQIFAPFGFKSAQARLRDVDADWAVLCTESPFRCGGFGLLDLSEAKLPRHECDEIDRAEISLHSSLQFMGSDVDLLRDSLFMLTTIAAVGRHTRIIDPFATIGAMASSHSLRCSHNNPTKSAMVATPHHRIWSFEEAVGYWQDTNVDDKSCPWSYYTTILDSHAKYNTLLALSPRGCIVKTADCCFACAQMELDTRFQDSNARRVLSIAIGKCVIRR